MVTKKLKTLRKRDVPADFAGRYLLLPDGKTLEACDDPMIWHHVMERRDPRIRLTRIAKRVIATEFTGIDAREDVHENGDPLVFVTIVEPDGMVRDYTSADAARAGHEEIVRDLADKLNEEPEEVDFTVRPPTPEEQKGELK